MSDIHEITAPYNFVPLSGWIHEPEWGNPDNETSICTSQDIPHPKGLSGTLNINLTSHTPILVGRQQDEHEKASSQKPGEVHFFKATNQYAIPGSSLKGMIRSVLEIASFAKMRMVDDQSLSIRDISGGGHLKDIYASRMKDQKAGFLRLKTTQDGSDTVAEVRPCEFAHITHNDLKEHLNLNRNDCLFKGGLSVPQKYEHWTSLSTTKSKNDSLPILSFITEKQYKQEHITLAKPSESGKFNGQLVFTGQITDKCKGYSGRVNKKGKYRDFIFYNKNSQSEPIPVSNKSLADFRKIHAENDPKSKSSWETFWKKRFKQGIEVPVFYHTNAQGVSSMGLAFMYKLPYQHSIGETINHSNPLHMPTKDELEAPLDLPEILLGMIAPEDSSITDSSNQNRSRKSRVSFGLCIAKNNPVPTPTQPTILNGPEPTYFPNYIQQPSATNNELGNGKAYGTYMDKLTEIRGWKRYPARPENKVAVQRIDGKQEEKHKVQTILYPLPALTEFEGKIRFHNLREEELGALLWTLGWGNNEELRHSLGMGKPFGYGQISINIKTATIFQNQTLQEQQYSQESLIKYSDSFESHMDKAYSTASKDKRKWNESTQIKNLLAMANPENPIAKAGKLKHMHMGTSHRDNDFVKAKKAGLTLPSYIDQPNSIDNDIFTRLTPEKLIREKEATIEKAEQEKQEQQKRAKLDAMPKLKREIQESLNINPQLRFHLALLKALETGKWEETEDIKEVANKIKAYMQENNLWAEKTAKKNPQKDKNHQNTLKTIGFLS